MLEKVRQAGVADEEIEITSEMAFAGAEALNLFRDLVDCPGEVTDRDLAVDVYIAMRRALARGNKALASP